MNKKSRLKRIAIVGGGPSGLFMYKRLVESNLDAEITIIERKSNLGFGMPYSNEGANLEHITNVSENEIPLIVTSIADWSKTLPKETLAKYNIDPAHFNSYKVLPRLFFGAYLAAQFQLLIKDADDVKHVTTVKLNTKVVDMIDHPKINETWVELADQSILKFDHVIICSGHNWPKILEGKIKGYYDSPYPPSKLNFTANYPIAIKGSSLTAIDALRTLARHHGRFSIDANQQLVYRLNKGCENFKLIMHSRSGLLPAVRFHLDDTHLNNDDLLTEEEIASHRAANEGFVSLDYIFDKNFKTPFITKDLSFYEKIKDLKLEEFVNLMMELREKLAPFALLKAEYLEAEKSIKRHQSVYWKEMLGALSFTLNYPAKYFSAEDMMRLHKVLMPLISIIIAYLPQSSCEELMSLHQAEVLDLINVGNESEVVAHDKGGVTYHYMDELGNEKAIDYQVFINCVGQPHLNLKEFPFKSLVDQHTLSEAKLKFKSNAKAEEFLNTNEKVVKAENGDFYLKISGVSINDNYQIVDHYGSYNERIYLMAVPYMGGYNPDYSGLDFCERASKKIIDSLIWS